MRKFQVNIIKRYTPKLSDMFDFARTNAIDLPEGDYAMTLNASIKAWDENGVTAKSNILYAPCGSPNSRAFATLNIMNPSAFRLIENGTLGFSSLGFAGNSTDGYLSTQWNPSTQGAGLYTQNNAGISVHISSYTAQADRSIFGLRNAAATAQINAIIRSAASSESTRFILNDNTNDDVTATVQTRGFYNFVRTSSTAKSCVRRNIGSNFTRTSVAVPNGILYLLARNSLSTATVDLFSGDTISYFRAGAALTATERGDELRAFIRLFLSNQRAGISVRSIPSRKVVYMHGGTGDWDETSLFGRARYENGGTIFDLYGGTDDTTLSDPIGYSVGVFDYTDRFSGTKAVSNPLINVSSYPALDSIFPMDCLVIGTDIYWFFTVRLNGVLTHDTYIATSTTSAPKTIGTLSALITTGSAGHFNHGFRIIKTHPDTTYWYAIMANTPNASTDPLKLNVLRCLRSADITNGANWSTVHTDIVARPSNLNANATYAQVYNDCFWDPVASNFKLYYGRFTPELQTNAFAIFLTESNDLSTFPVGKEVLSPTGSSSIDPIENIDSGYTSLPFVDRTNGLIYYAGRRGGADTPYVANCVKKYREWF